MDSCVSTFADMGSEESSPPDGVGAASDVAVVDDGPSTSDEGTAEPPAEASEPPDSQKADAEKKDEAHVEEAPANDAGAEDEPKGDEPSPAEPAAESNVEEGGKEASSVR